MNTRPLTEADLDERAHLLASWPANQPNWTASEHAGHVAGRGHVSLEEIRWADSREEAEREALPLVGLMVLWVVFLALVCAAYLIWGEAAQMLACAPLVTRNGGKRIDTAQMLASGAITGPHRKTRPLTLTWRQRLRRWWAANVLGGPEWGDEFKG